MNIQKSIPNAQALKSAVVSSLLSVASIPGFAAGYLVQEIPTPKIAIPAGLTARPVCLSINKFGHVACNLEIIQTQIRTPIDRLAATPKLLASYAYSWDSTFATHLPVLLSSKSSNTLDRANVINNGGLVSGSTATRTTRPQGAIWFGAPGPTTHGRGEITELNDHGDYVMNDQLFINNRVVSYPGKLLHVQAINPSATAATPVKPAGTQAFSSKLQGTGRLYRTAPAATVARPYALSSIASGVVVKDITDNGNFVISGTPNTPSGQTALICTGVATCRSYHPTVGAPTQGRSTPWITLNAVNSKLQAVGTDGGIALLVNPPTAAFPNGQRVNLNSQLQRGALSSGWFLNFAYDINDRGQIIGTGLKGRKQVAYLLTPH